MQSACALLFVVSLVLAYFSYYLINGTIFEKKKEVTKHKMRVSVSLLILSETFLTLKRIQRDIINLLKPSGNFTHHQV
jgi:ABC-type sulfate transport system permease subunit